jgi:hypothetical protein
LVFQVTSPTRLTAGTTWTSRCWRRQRRLLVAGAVRGKEEALWGGSGDAREAVWEGEKEGEGEDQLWQGG